MADIIRKPASSPKFQVHNNALISAQRGEFFNEILQDSKQWGRIIESCIGAHLLNNSITGNFNLYYWRHRNNEVDFVIEKKDKIIGIEVKSGVAKPTSGMEKFKKSFHPYKVLLVGQNGLPWQDFLQIDPQELFK